MQFKRLGYLQGLAAGLMLCISMLDLMPAATEEVGFAAANTWFFVGVAFFAAVVHFIPEPSSEGLVLDDSEPATPTVAKSKKQDGDGMAAGPGATDKGDKGTPAGKKPIKRAGESAAAAAKADGAAAAPAAHASGSGAVAERAARREAKKRVLLSGLITAIGIALHNFPEGVAVFLASMKSHAVGASLAFAIALHNVPEGVAVALPVYFATGSRWRGFLYAATSGLAEPAAVVVLALFFPSQGLDKQLVEKLLAAVGGIMAFLSISELLPLAFEHAGRSAAVLALFAGMAIMSANLYILDHWLGHDH
ncbi:hypothetical protein HYH02_006784 [Chlamydomonas schloesseri]|uniref:Uncharacterized protein n=1 Tax=Chlamydomonas schloesseri TaxID=2026947 RepID=A0A835WID9_9CHLO|nr:hypothetical protein HYH02_006784 [Chlamydomonas schloesseri]|eukprot:KAG2448199.1 hypothetical protein HYH02_006784 [Chlamydomonas schloesseri]